MTGHWHTHDAGLFSLEVPRGWLVEQPNTGTLRVRSPAKGPWSSARVEIALIAVSREAKHELGTVEAQMQLKSWVESQRNVRIRQSIRAWSNRTNSIAMTEGLQQVRTDAPWYKRLWRRESTVLWRYWALVNPHVTVLASCHGTPAAMERRRQAIDRVVASVLLPERDVLIGKRFTEMVVSLARSWFPETAVAVIDEAHVQFGSQNVSVAGLHRRYLASPDELSTQVRAFLTAVLVDAPASALVGTWERAAQRVMPIFLPAEHLPPKAVRAARQEWVNGLSIAYALEARNDENELAAERIITEEDLTRWSVDIEEVHERAIHNLIGYSHEHTMEGGKSDGCTMLCLSTRDRHNAARVLLPDLHRKLRIHLGSTFYAAIPTREVLVAFSSSDEDVLTHMRQEVAADYSRAAKAGMGVSPKLFLVTPDGIAGDPAIGFDI